MSYLLAADFVEPTTKPWTVGIHLPESVAGNEDHLQAVIDNIIEARVDALLGDTFEPAGGDPDTTIEVNAYGGSRLYVPRSIRSITTVQTRSATGALTTESASLYRIVSSVSGGTTKVGQIDALDIVPGLNLSTGGWPYGTQTVRLTGKFGFTTPPTDVKRLAAKLTYQFFRPPSAGGTTIQTRQTQDGTITYGSDSEIEAILDVYGRFVPLVR